MPSPSERGYRLPGGSHAVLMLHGLYGNPSEMLYVGRRLNRAGYTVSIPYIDGCGVDDTRGAGATAPWTQWFATVENHFLLLQQSHEKVSVAGLCVGANLALMLAIKHGQGVQRLCLYSTTLFFDGWNASRLRFVRHLIYVTPLKYFIRFREREPWGLKDPRVRRWIASQMLAEGRSDAGAYTQPASGLLQTEKMIKKIKKGLPEIQVPTLIIHAREDDTTSLRSAELVRRYIGSADIRMVILENSYHTVTLDQEKDKVVTETLQFLAAAEGNTSACSPDVDGPD